MPDFPDYKNPSSGGWTKKKVAGVPVIYLALGFVAILAVIAWRMKSSPDLTASDTADQNDAEADAAVPGNAVPPVVSGTVVAQPNSVEDQAVPFEDNSTWLHKGVAYLVSKGYNPSDAQRALQAYLSGADMTYQQGTMVDLCIKQFGLPPDDFPIGNTAPKPATRSVPPVTVTPKPKVKPASGSHPVPKPVPPKKVYYIVKPGDTLSKIGAKYHRDWHVIYNANKAVIGPNPNIIHPGQRLVIP